MKDQRNALIWTSERTPLVLPLAGLGERALGYLIDLSLLLLGVALILFLYSIKGDVLVDWVALPRILQALLLAGGVACFLGYDIFFETLFDGQTPGKKIARLRVIRGDGTRPDFITALLRNLLRRTRQRRPSARTCVCIELSNPLRASARMERRRHS